LLILPLIVGTFYFRQFCHLSFKQKTEWVPLDQLLPEAQAEEIIDPESPMASFSDLLKDSDQVYSTPQEHFQERYPTTYLHPVFSKPLSRPWVPRVLASYISRASRDIQATQKSEQVEMESLQKGSDHYV
jgi:hypothetical protein